MSLGDGPYFSPDGGRFWVLGRMIYWEDGEVSVNSDYEFPMRYMPKQSSENYSLWTDEKRKEVKREWARKRAEWAKEKEKDDLATEALLKSAAEKLTPEEYDAVYCEGRRGR